MFNLPYTSKEQMRIIARLGELRGILDVLCEGWRTCIGPGDQRREINKVIQMFIDITRDLENESDPDDTKSDHEDYGPTEDFDEYCRKKE